MQVELYVVNVFSERGMMGGNQLGVVPDAGRLEKHIMQSITKQLNYSESTFVIDQSSKTAEVRIFLPIDEIPYAGHPTVGSAYLLELLWRRTKAPRSHLQMQLMAGEVMTYFQNIEAIDPGRVYMDQLRVKTFGKYQRVDAILDALRIDRSELLSQDLYIISPSALKFLFIPLKEPETIKEMNPSISELKNLLGKTDLEPYVFAPQGLDGGDVRARFFAPNSGIDEDPATGSAQHALMKALELLDLLPAKQEIVVEQGYEMGRPSKLYNRIEQIGTSAGVKTGGNCALVIEGMLHI